MGVHIETDMRRDAFDHLLRLDHTYYNNTKVGLSLIHISIVAATLGNDAGIYGSVRLIVGE